MTLFKRVDGTTAYRLAMFFIVLSVTPFSSILPKFNGFKPLWETVTEFQEANKVTQKKLDDLATKVETLSAQSSVVESRVIRVESDLKTLQTTFQGFQVDFEKYRKEYAPQQ